MAQRDPNLILSAAPFLKRSLTTPKLMLEVVLSLLPALAAAVYFFGLGALLIVLSCTFAAVLTEWAFGGKRTIFDGSALLTGLILALTLPPTLPLWIAFIGGAVAIGMGKLIFGGLGQNQFNPALVGRAFLQAAFPTALTTWRTPGSLATFLKVPGSVFAWPLMHSAVDVVSTASPLSKMKFSHIATPVSDLLWGNVAGSLGETSGLLIGIAGLYLLVRRAFDWRIPLAILLTVAVFSTVTYLVAPGSYPHPAFMLLSGGLLFGTVYMATDPVTSPIAPMAAWLFGFGIGVLVVLIRLWGGLPEGVMYAILLMNATTPLLERAAQQRPFGRAERPS